MTNSGTLARQAALAIGVFGLVCSDLAWAFPLDDQTGSSPTARGTLAAPDARDLRHQMQILGGPAAPSGTGGWIIIPRLDVMGLFTDNALQVSSPRQWDFATILSPGLSAVADTSRLQLRLDYSPILSVYARTTSQNSLSHYLNATGLLTVVPEQVFVDVRAVAGVQPISGGFGGVGGLGLAQAGSFGASLGNSAALNRRNQSQTFTASVSPYVTRQYGDYGTLRIGASFQYSSLSSVDGFGTPPFTTTGDDSQSLVTTEQTARFVTGEFLGRIRNTTEATLSQSPISSTTTTTAGPTGRRIGSSYSSRQIITNRVAYAINHAVTVFATFGYENIRYRGGTTQHIEGLVWDVGTTLLPNPDSTITISYGKREGAQSLSLDGRYALTPRTVITATYSSRLTTQLQSLQQQLDQGVINSDGILVNSQTGAPLLIGNNGAALIPGLFRNDTFVLTTQTRLDRDAITLTLLSSARHPSSGSTTSVSTTARTVSASWTRDLRPDLALTTILAYTNQSLGGTSGTSSTVTASVGLNYLITDSLTGRIRYSYFKRQGNTGAIIPAFSRLNFTQNLLTIGITKQF